jgi:uncharacterized membrane protein
VKGLHLFKDYFAVKTSDMMDQKTGLIKNWIVTGIVCGLLVSIIYPSLIMIPLPTLLQVILAMAFGPLLGISSVGLYHFLRLHQNSVSLNIAVVSNIIAGVFVTTMILVQLAIQSALPEGLDSSEKWIWNMVNQVQLGLDVVWDVFIFLGTLLFAICAWGHPKLGKIVSIAGIIIAVSLIVLNAYTFPVPPAESELIDLGPLVGIWYLAVTIIIIARLSWVKEKISAI